MKIEISNSTDTYRLTDGEEIGITGQIVPYGEPSILDETLPASEQWWALIDDDGECDGLAHKGESDQSDPVGFELDCEFEDEDADATDTDEDAGDDV